MRAAPLIFLFLIGLFAAACGGGSEEGATLLFGSTSGVVEYDIRDGSTTILVPAAERETLSDPAVSPDGQRVAYVKTSAPRPTGGVLDVASEVRVAKRDGSEPMTIFQRAVPGEVASSPRWLDDATLLLLLRSFKDPTNSAGGNRYRLVRMDIDTGALTDVVEGAFQFDLSPDGTQIAYLLVESPEEQPLYTANSDGSGAERIIDRANSGLDGMTAVAFANDGTSLFILAHEVVT